MTSGCPPARHRSDSDSAENATGPRLTEHQHHPHSRNRRRAACKFGPSRGPHGSCAGGLLSVAALPPLRPHGSHVAKSRSFRTLGGPCVDAALRNAAPCGSARSRCKRPSFERSEEHTSELQSRFDLVCRLLLEKKKT